MSFSIALSVVRTTELSAKEVFWNIYFEIDVLRVALRRFQVTSDHKWLSAKNIPEYKRSQSFMLFFFRIILSLPLLT